MYDDDPDELAAHLRDEGDVKPCLCGEAVVDECEFCATPLCAGGLFMHQTLGCTLAQRAEAHERSGGDGA